MTYSTHLQRRKLWCWQIEDGGRIQPEESVLSSKCGSSTDEIRGKGGRTSQFGSRDALEKVDIRGPNGGRRIWGLHSSPEFRQGCPKPLCVLIMRQGSSCCGMTLSSVQTRLSRPVCPFFLRSFSGVTQASSRLLCPAPMGTTEATLRMENVDVRDEWQDEDLPR